MKNFFGSLLIILSIILCSCKPDVTHIPTADKGVLDLTQYDFVQHGSLALDGQWKFYPGQLGTNSNDKAQWIRVPGEWNSDKNLKHPGYGSYELLIKLSSKTPVLGLKVIGVSTSYILEINGKLVDSVGVVAASENESHPAYSRKIYPISVVDSTLRVVLKVANYEHYKGGILQPLVLGAYEPMNSESHTYSFVGGTFIGICIINAVVYLVLFLFMREGRYFLYYSIFSLVIVIHMFCLVDRMMFSFLTTIVGPAGWHIAYKIELFTIFLSFALTFLFYDSLFKDILSKKIIIGIWVVLMLQGLYVLAMPAPLFTYADLFVPFNILILFIVIIILFIKAHKKNQEGATTIAVFNFFMIAVAANENFVFNKHVHDLQLFHFAVIIYVVGVSVVLLRKVITAFSNEKVLAVKLHGMNEKFERQNKNLEEIVDRRTAQLIEAEKKSYELQMEKRNRDMDMLAASNIMKLQFTRNLIQELEELPKAEKELKPALNALIKKLKGQESIEEKLDILQKDLERINAEFYERLIQKFPDLSKTERELCAYIKLSLSNKDIAELRKTSLNTINVSRSRLRKKLGLTRDEELEMFIQQF